MPRIVVQLLVGRTLEQKRELARLVTDATCQALRVKPAEVIVVLEELASENFATGGRLWVDRDRV